VNRLRNAFTLIELLVVIAIIAILAAILFPVFAQAKVAAKNAASLANLKQNTLGIILYSGDYDDIFPKRGTMNGNGSSWATGACNDSQWGCPSWDKLIYTYTKNYGIMESGLDRAAKVPSPLGDIKRSYRAANNVIRGVGGNSTWGPAEFPVRSISQTAVPMPANSIMLTEQRNGAVVDPPWWIWSSFYENWVWWTGSANTLAYEDSSTPVGNAQKYYSGIDFTSNAGKAGFAYVDGHVKTAPRGYIFPGYERKTDYAAAVNPTLRGVCLDYEDFTTGTPRECLLPQN